VLPETAAVLEMILASLMMKSGIPPHPTPLPDPNTKQRGEGENLTSFIKGRPVLGVILLVRNYLKEGLLFRQHQEALLAQIC
jgi:hypothetical protein